MIRIWRALTLSILALSVACSDGALCDANEGTFCNQCFGEMVTCGFEGVEVTEQSCEGCQARAALYEELCETGSTATVEEVEAGMVCEEVDTGN